MTARLQKLEAFPQSEKDRQRAWHRFRAKFLWTEGEVNRDKVLFANFAVDRGTLVIYELGILKE